MKEEPISAQNSTLKPTSSVWQKVKLIKISLPTLHRQFPQTLQMQFPRLLLNLPRMVDMRQMVVVIINPAQYSQQSPEFDVRFSCTDRPTHQQQSYRFHVYVSFYLFGFLL